MGDELRVGMKGLRINKFFTERGVCSRRSAVRNDQGETWNGSAPACVWTVQEPSLLCL